VLVLSFKFHQNWLSCYRDVSGQNLAHCITLDTGLYNSLYERIQSWYTDANSACGTDRNQQRIMLYDSSDRGRKHYWMRIWNVNLSFITGRAPIIKRSQLGLYGSGRNRQDGDMPTSQLPLVSFIVIGYKETVGLSSELSLFHTSCGW